MRFPDENRLAAATGGPWFATTHWSLVLRAGDSAAPDGSDALERLCRTYWYPLYCYVRWRGHTAEDAQDLTQAFFAQFLRKKALRLADPERGKFRTFLLTSLNNFLIHERERANTVKRGAGQSHVPWDQSQAETQYRLEPALPVAWEAPENSFDRQWALALFQQALGRLRQEHATTGKLIQFEELKGFLTSTADEGGYADVAARLQMTARSVAVLVHRLRQRYGELAREEVAHTVASRAEIKNELRYLIELVAG